MRDQKKLRDFSKLLRESRKAKRKTQKQLLEMLHNRGYEKYSKGDVSKWEHGYYRPPAEVIEDLEDVLREPPGFLLDAAGFYEQAEFRRQEHVISRLEEYVKEQFRLLAAANNLKYKDLDSGKWVSPSLEDKIRVWGEMQSEGP